MLHETLVYCIPRHYGVERSEPSDQIRSPALSSTASIAHRVAP